MNNTAKRLPMSVKWLFASGDFAKTLLVVMTAAFSLFFYTDVLGMDAKIVATIILIAKIWDFIPHPQQAGGKVRQRQTGSIRWCYRRGRLSAPFPYP